MTAYEIPTGVSRDTGGMELLSVGQVAAKYGVTVRTLHHYDQIGLLCPSERSRADYRLYTSGDLDRLATIVTYRRLGFGLTEVAALLRGDGSSVEHLRRQRDTVTTKIDELTHLVDAIDARLEREMTNQPATDADLRQIFGEGFNEDYQAEAQQRWGNTDAWRQSSERTAKYTKADWEQIKAETEAVNQKFLAAFDAGLPATSDQAMAAAEAHRLQIDTWHFDLDHDFHRKLAELYAADARFAKVYEDQAPGLASYIRDAINANADRHA